MVGLFFGAGVFGHISDRLGRKRAYYVTMVILTAGGVGSAFTQAWWTYGLCRILVGVGYGSYQVINCVYPLEFIGHRWRTLCGTVGFWACGGVLLSLFVSVLYEFCISFNFKLISYVGEVGLFIAAVRRAQTVSVVEDR